MEKLKDFFEFVLEWLAIGTAFVVYTIAILIVLLGTAGPILALSVLALHLFGVV